MSNAERIEVTQHAVDKATADNIHYQRLRVIIETAFFTLIFIAVVGFGVYQTISINASRTARSHQETQIISIVKDIRAEQSVNTERNRELDGFLTCILHSANPDSCPVPHT